MTDFEFYRTLYMGDSIAEADFPRLIRLAGETLARYKRIYSVISPQEDAEAMALCAMADALAYYESALNGAGGAVSSASIGSVSVSYAGTASAADLSQEAQAAELFRCACLYLDIYRGCF